MLWFGFECLAFEMSCEMAASERGKCDNSNNSRGLKSHSIARTSWDIIFILSSLFRTCEASWIHQPAINIFNVVTGSALTCETAVKRYPNTVINSQQREFVSGAATGDRCSRDKLRNFWWARLPVDKLRQSTWFVDLNSSLQKLCWWSFRVRGRSRRWN